MNLARGYICAGQMVPPAEFNLPASQTSAFRPIQRCVTNWVPTVPP